MKASPHIILYYTKYQLISNYFFFHVYRCADRPTLECFWDRAIRLVGPDLAPSVVVGGYLDTAPNRRGWQSMSPSIITSPTNTINVTIYTLTKPAMYS